MQLRNVRRFNFPAFVAAFLCVSIAVAKDLPEPELTDDGLYTQPWFISSFLDLREDLADAKKEGKTLAVLWELRGCPYCRVLHTTNFVRPEILELMRSKFVVLQLNYLGGRQVIDLDGQEISEKKLARKHGIRFTPTIQFFGPDSGGKNGEKKEIFRMAGYYKPFHFLAMLEFIDQGAYRNTPFRNFLVRKAKAMHAKGIDVNAW